MRKFLSGLFQKDKKEAAAAEEPQPKEEAKASEPSPLTPGSTSSHVFKPLYSAKETEMDAPDESVPSQGPVLSPYQHLPFEGDLKAAIETLVWDLADVYPQTLEEWENGFRRDDNPEQEIAGWIHLAAILKAMAESHKLAQPEKQECFRLLIACFTGSRDTIGSRFKRKLISPEQFDQSVNFFYGGGY